MAGIVFKRIDNLLGLYLTHDATPRTARFIYINSGGKSEPEIGLREAWNGSVSDAYCFVPYLPKDPQRLWRRVIAMPHINRDGHVVLWISDPDALKQIQPLKIDTIRQAFITQDDNDYHLRNSTLRISRGCRVEVNAAQNGLVISSRDRYSPRLLRDAPAAQGTPGALDVPVATVELPLTVGGQGSLQFDVALDEDNLDALDVGLRYFYRGVDAGSPVRSPRYPVFNPDSRGKVRLRAYVDRYALADVTRTYYAFQRDDSGRMPVLGSYFRTHLGHALGLIPEIDTPASASGHPRLVFVDKPATTQAGDPDHIYDAVYLTPAGDFRLQVARPGAAKLMCGLSATEAIGLVPAPAGGSSAGVLSFHPFQPAFAPDFPATTNSGTDSLLDDTYTTSYVGVRSESTPQPNPALDIYAQPESAPLFYRPADSPAGQGFMVFFDAAAGALPPGRLARGMPPGALCRADARRFHRPVQRRRSHRFRTTGPQPAAAPDHGYGGTVHGANRRGAGTGPKDDHPAGPAGPGGGRVLEEACPGGRRWFNGGALDVREPQGTISKGPSAGSDFWSPPAVPPKPWGLFPPGHRSAAGGSSWIWG